MGLEGRLLELPDPAVKAGVVGLVGEAPRLEEERSCVAGAAVGERRGGRGRKDGGLEEAREEAGGAPRGGGGFEPERGVDGGVKTARGRPARSLDPRSSSFSSLDPDALFCISCSS